MRKLGIPVTPFPARRPGTSGLRKKVTRPLAGLVVAAAHIADIPGILGRWEPSVVA